MSTDIRIKKGLDIKLKGRAEHKLSTIGRSKIFAINPPHFYGINPKMSVKVGDKVNVGESIFYAKSNEQMKFTSPVSGEIKEIVRGAKRKILSVLVAADSIDVYKDFGVKSPNNLDAAQIKEILLDSGCWAFIKQRPYDIIANPSDTPKAIFISAYATAPLAASHEFALQGRENEFQAGVDVLSKLVQGNLHLSFGGNSASFFNNIKNANLHNVTGKHPAGNVGVQIAKIDPINSGERVWVINPQEVATIGNLFLTGKLDATKVIALAGSEVC